LRQVNSCGGGQLETKQWRAILLIGPTGSGKTPLGRLLDLRGFREQRCIHFDFGNTMRSCLDEPVSQLTKDEIHIVRESLVAGTLLEDEHFIIAEKLLLSFIEQRKADEDTLVVLNGLPRHIGQAIAMEQFIDMQLLVRLDCPPDVALHRIQMNAGGDRCGRNDDTLARVRERVDLFRQRTEPLLGHYRGGGLPVISVAVGVATTAQDMYRQIENQYLPRT
jgi:adenylate kinase